MPKRGPFGEPDRSVMLCAPTKAIDITPRLNGEVFFLNDPFEFAELAQTRVYNTYTP